MRRVVVVVPELLGEPSVLRGTLPTIERMAAAGRVFKLDSMPDVETPEATYLGMRPDEVRLRQGPLTVSALGADPPPRSTHFHVSLMSFVDGVARRPGVEIGAPEQREIARLAKKLDTRLLTFVEGEGLDHGLVWENVGEHHTTSAANLDGKLVREHLPEGDAEVQLRRFIDDSANLLTESELNLRRADEDLPVLNLLWPWGEGVRTPVPNLALRRGIPALVISSSMRMAGLSRLAGYRHAPRNEVGRGLSIKLTRIGELAAGEDASLILIDSVGAFREAGQLEEADWLVRELDSVLLASLLERSLNEPSRLTLLAPGVAKGLGVSFTTRDHGNNWHPFDERSLDEHEVPTVAIHDAVERAIG